MTEETRGIR